MNTPNLTTEVRVLSKEQLKIVLGGNVKVPAGYYYCCPYPGDVGVCSACIYYDGTGSLSCIEGRLQNC